MVTMAAPTDSRCIGGEGVTAVRGMTCKVAADRTTEDQRTGDGHLIEGASTGSRAGISRVRSLRAGMAR
jgi:hypothetical protein